MGQQLFFTAFHQRGYQTVAELASDDRTGLQYFPRSLCQSVHPCHDNVVNGGRNGELTHTTIEIAAIPTFIDHFQIDERFDEFLDEKRNALGFFQDELFQFRSYFRGAQQVRRHLQALAVAQTIQNHLVVIGSGAPGVDEFGPVGKNKQHR